MTGAPEDVRTTRRSRPAWMRTISGLAVALLFLGSAGASVGCASGQGCGMSGPRGDEGSSVAAHSCCAGEPMSAEAACCQAGLSGMPSACHGMDSPDGLAPTAALSGAPAKDAAPMMAAFVAPAGSRAPTVAAKAETGVLRGARRARNALFLIDEAFLI